jgi:hypothetical protein
MKRSEHNRLVRRESALERELERIAIEAQLSGRDPLATIARIYPREREARVSQWLRWRAAHPVLSERGQRELEKRRRAHAVQLLEERRAERRGAKAP